MKRFIIVLTILIAIVAGCLYLCAITGSTGGAHEIDGRVQSKMHIVECEKQMWDAVTQRYYVRTTAEQWCVLVNGRWLHVDSATYASIRKHDFVKLRTDGETNGETTN